MSVGALRDEKHWTGLKVGSGNMCRCKWQTLPVQPPNQRDEAKIQDPQSSAMFPTIGNYET
ncbi:hypothetical protein GTO27_02160 [Candidatus Bathyarchaeota archaeon]|nr:hypothetical protein [Candidatus Bathyarchaeota archaeon]